MSKLTHKTAIVAVMAWEGEGFWFSSAPVGKFQDSTLNYAVTTSFHILSSLLCMNLPHHSVYEVRVTDSVIK
jgi:hypothetical protein